MLLLISIMSPVTSSAAASDSSVRKRIESPGRIIESPDIIYHDDGSFSFIVFGDSRTGDIDERSLEKARFSSLRFTENDAVDEEDREYVTFRNELFDDIADRLTETQFIRNKDICSFALFSGDFVRQGNEAYWNEVKYAFLDNVKSKDGSGRIFPVIGNHEIWAGEYSEETYGIKNATASALKIYFETFPWLVGSTGKKEPDTGLHNYAFFADENVFVTLCTGNNIFDDCFPENGDTMFLCEQCTFGEQMKWFKKVLEYGITQKGVKNIFVQYHKPSYSNSRHSPLKQCCDPVNVLSEFKSNYGYLNMYVFNGHNHTTEIYRTDDDITVMVAGGGGAPQNPSTMNIEWNRFKDTPKELFWDSLKPYINEWQIRTCYFIVTVNADKVEIQEMVLTNKGDLYRFEEGIHITSDLSIIAPDHITGMISEHSHG
jgi:hypothetical protein